MIRTVGLVAVSVVGVFLAVVVFLVAIVVTVAITIAITVTILTVEFGNAVEDTTVDGDALPVHRGNGVDNLIALDMILTNHIQNAAGTTAQGHGIGNHVVGRRIDHNVIVLGSQFLQQAVDLVQ